MLYLKDKQTILFRDKGQKYRPVSLYKGANKITGYEYSEVTGEVLSVSDTYNDSASITINGKTTETGTGTKSPSNPYTLSSVANFDLLSCAKNLFDKTKQAYGRLIITIGADFALNTQPGYATTELIYVGANKNVATSGSLNWIVFYDISKKVTRITNVKLVTTSATEFYIGFYSASANNLDNVQVEFGTVATPYTPFRGLSTVNFPHTLRSLPDGTRDYIADKKLYSKTHGVLFNGSEAWVMGSIELANTVVFHVVLNPEGKPSNANKLISSHFPSRSSGISSVDSEFVQITGGYIYFRINKARLSTVNALGFKAWLAANNVYVLYEKVNDAQTVTDLDYEDVLTYYPQTQIYTTATVQPMLEATIRTF